ncbi:putative methyltransferase [Candidatus Kinetoplastibacterium desouzaii TCC079E]|uniref:Putative methyltransferase n=1 Tax=Candidatus Kinetoplastidibacterium desouzai TCC079E TaxID=1208919 RepID=M1LMR3_9PROT|nr:SAM-dependent methyltransferase [Candidatus Kinetoplastibacterium desouzaii]AGF47017.1 putative methyltransferase [Candidatus Kinetoplastibacterium desouzaii TCC079E]
MIETLHLIPVSIGNQPLDFWLPEKTITIASNIKTYIAENAKTARCFLQSIKVKHAINEVEIHTLNEKTNITEIKKWLLNSKEKNMGLVSEAGCPAIADPGAIVVRTAHVMGISVRPWVGPSSIILSLMASGLNGQNFVFRGYPPKQPHERKTKITLWEKESIFNNQTQIMIETPYRNIHLYNDLINNLKKNTHLCIASLVNSQEELIKTRTIKEWKGLDAPNIDKKPTIFLYCGNYT